MKILFHMGMFVLFFGLTGCGKDIKLVDKDEKDAGVVLVPAVVPPTGKTMDYLRVNARLSGVHRAYVKDQEAVTADIVAAPSVPGACREEYKTVSESAARRTQSGVDAAGKVDWVHDQFIALPAHHLPDNVNTSESLKSLSDLSDNVQKTGQEYQDAQRAFIACLKAKAPKSD